MSLILELTNQGLLVPVGLVLVGIIIGVAVAYKNRAKF